MIQLSQAATTWSISGYSQRHVAATKHTDCIRPRLPHIDDVSIVPSLLWNVLVLLLLLLLLLRYPTMHT